MLNKNDKRERLLKAAQILIYQKGFNLTTLADIALEAKVPLGNVYYYFKTKEAIGEAVLKQLSTELQLKLDSCNSEANPLLRLYGYLDHINICAQNINQFGCEIGSLCQELAKQSGPLSDLAKQLLIMLIDWVDYQFNKLGFDKTRSKNYALQYVAILQGMSLLVNSCNNTEYLQNISQTTRAWLKQLTHEVIEV